MIAGVKNPVVFAQMYQHSSSDTNTFKAISPKEQLQLEAAADMGALMMDGLTDGLWLMNNGDIAQEDVEQTAFAILQAGRLRMVKTANTSLVRAVVVPFMISEPPCAHQRSNKRHDGIEGWHHGMYR